MTDNNTQDKLPSDTSKESQSNDYRKNNGSDSVIGIGNETGNIPPEMAAAISALVANREKGKGNSTMRVVTAKEMEQLELEREMHERKEKGEIIVDLKEPDAETQAAIDSFIHSPFGPDPKETIDYGYPIRMTLKFLDNVVSGVPHIMTIRRLDYLDPETDNEEFPEYSRWFMSNIPDYNPEDPADYDPNKSKLYTFKAITIEWELGAFEVIKYLPYIGSIWDYSSQADPGEKTGKMVPASQMEVVYKKEVGSKTENKSQDKEDTPTIITMPSSSTKEINLTGNEDQPK